ncbi:hypothetical protein CASFOL_010671 [Castilleja foliolosa]|uniref:Uncharacterized protein n=1 Tax=Castilleja foliolosa TaxID=1961234 RepID=A0ABD3DXG0_9LAMI
MDSQSSKTLPPPSKPPASAAGSGVRRNSYPAPARSRLVRYQYRHEVAVPENRLRNRQPACKEIVLRALTPPSQRLSWRWRNFRPTPSRFSNVSMA